MEQGVSAQYAVQCVSSQAAGKTVTLAWLTLLGVLQSSPGAKGIWVLRRQSLGQRRTMGMWQAVATKASIQCPAMLLLRLVRVGGEHGCLAAGSM